MPFVTEYHPAVKNLKQILMERWSMIHNQPLLKTMFAKTSDDLYKSHMTKFLSIARNETHVSDEKHLLRRHSSPGVYFIF